MSEALEAFNDLKEEGVLIEIKRKIGGSVDKITGAFSQGQNISYKTWAAPLPASKGTVQGFDVKAEDLINTEQRFFIMSTIAEYGSAYMPMKNDTLVSDNFEFTINGCTPIKYKTENVVYRVGCFR